MPRLVALVALVGAIGMAWMPSMASASPERIVGLGGGITATLYALGLADDVVAIDASSPPPPSGAALPRVGYYRQLSSEGVLALKPDLIVGPAGTGPATVVAQLEASGVPVKLLPEVETLAGARARIEAIGALVGRADAAKALVGAFDRDFAAAQAIIAGRQGPPPRVLFLFVHGGATLQVAGEGTAAEAMIEAAGGVNAIDGYEGYRPLTAEGVVLARPQIILATPRSLAGAGGAEALWKHPGLRVTPAGQAKRLAVVDDVRLLGFGPETGAVVRELAEVFAQ